MIKEDDKLLISNIKTCQEGLHVLSQSKEEPFMEYLFYSTIKYLEDYKKIILERNGWTEKEVSSEKVVAAEEVLFCENYLNMSRREFLQKEMKNAQSFELTEEEVDGFFSKIRSYIETNDYSAFRHMQTDEKVESLSERQEICSSLAIDSLFRGDSIQALHETLDVLSDDNKDTRLSFNEYVVLRNILLTYKNIKNME